MLIELLSAGLAALNDYIATHVLTCLVPASLLAGAMVTFIRREAIPALLGERVSKSKSFPLAAGSSFLVAACSCTVIPVTNGLYYAGAGIGAAFIVLWIAPAALQQCSRCRLQASEPGSVIQNGHPRIPVSFEAKGTRHGGHRIQRRQNPHTWQ